jgi:undecaprenyl pyrophosphate synthase
VNGNADYDGADLIDAGNGDMVVVNFNYRVGPYGFLAGKEVAENKTMSMNNGLRDQRKLLEWVQKHIHEVCSCKRFSSTLLTHPSLAVMPAMSRLEEQVLEEAQSSCS